MWTSSSLNQQIKVKAANAGWWIQRRVIFSSGVIRPQRRRRMNVLASILSLERIGSLYSYSGKQVVWTTVDLWTIWVWPVQVRLYEDFFWYSTVHVFSLPYDFLNNIFFSVASFIVRIQYLIHTIYERCVNQLFTLLGRLLVNSRLSVAKFWGSQKLYADFLLCAELASQPYVVQASTVQNCIKKALHWGRKVKGTIHESHKGKEGPQRGESGFLL